MVQGTDMYPLLKDASTTSAACIHMLFRQLHSIGRDVSCMRRDVMQVLETFVEAGRSSWPSLVHFAECISTS